MSDAAGSKAPQGNYGTFIGIAASALIIIAIIAVTQLEVYERTKWERPSSEIRSDNFYVIGKWLGESGHPVRFRPRLTGIENLSPQEGALFIQASLFDWEKGEDVLLPWVREGGALLISIDAPESAPEQLLEDLGIKLWYSAADESNDDSNTVEDSEEDLEDGLEDDEFFPVYDRDIAFEIMEQYTKRESLILRGPEGAIRLIRIPLGKGWLTVTGECYCMYTRYLTRHLTRHLSGHLSNKANIGAAWEFTGGLLKAERPGMLFIRGRRAAQGFLGALLERGNLAAPVVSALVLIFIGFWMVIPVFGIPLAEVRKRRSSIVDRFSAEARFLDHYGALRTYLEVYLRELHRRDGRELGQDVKEVEHALAAGKKPGRRKMAVYLKNLMSALERI
jgi:hypothetical protein